MLSKIPLKLDFLKKSVGINRRLLLFIQYLILRFLLNGIGNERVSNDTMPWILNLFETNFASTIATGSDRNSRVEFLCTPNTSG